MMLDLRRSAMQLRPDVPQLPHLAASARATWLGRMINEHASGRVFSALADQLDAAGMGGGRSETCREFAREELTHGILCGAVVEALGGEARAEAPDPVAFPLHPAVAPIVGVVRNVVSICCMAETVAVSLIGAERLEMPDGELRELLTRIWSDEVGHARFGWRLLAEVLPGLSVSQREGVDAYLGVAFRHLEQHELAHIAAGARPPAEGAALGLCAGADARALFYATVDETIVPGLSSVGLRAEPAWRTRDGGSPLRH